MVDDLIKGKSGKFVVNLDVHLWYFIDKKSVTMYVTPTEFSFTHYKLNKRCAPDCYIWLLRCSFEDKIVWVIVCLRLLF